MLAYLHCIVLHVQISSHWSNCIVFSFDMNEVFDRIWRVLCIRNDTAYRNMFVGENLSTYPKYKIMIYDHDSFKTYMKFNDKNELKINLDLLRLKVSNLHSVYMLKHGLNAYDPKWDFYKRFKLVEK